MKCISLHLSSQSWPETSSLLLSLRRARVNHSPVVDIVSASIRFGLFNAIKYMYSGAIPDYSKGTWSMSMVYIWSIRYGGLRSYAEKPLMQIQKKMTC